MSHTQNKADLFGPKKTATASGSTSKAPVTTSIPASAPPKVVSKTAGSAIKFSGKTTGLSMLEKQKKVTEARDFSEKGMTHLKTTIFQWKPDHLLAAPYFEKSSDAYKAAEDNNLACEMMLKAADSHEACGALQSAALATKKAADLTKLMGDTKKTVSLLKKSAEFWGVSGDIQRYGETLFLAAKELEATSPEFAKKMFEKALEVLCPASTPKSQLNSMHPASLELFRTALSFFISTAHYKEALALASRMADIFVAFDNEQSMCKMFLTITLIQLTLGDPVQAQQTYLQEHLNNNVYLASKESECADLFVLAFVNNDMEKLEEAKAHPQVNYLDKATKDIARELSILSMDFEDSSPVAVKPNIVTANAAASNSLFAGGSKQKAASSSSTAVPTSPFVDYSAGEPKTRSDSISELHLGEGMHFNNKEEKGETLSDDGQEQTYASPQHASHDLDGIQIEGEEEEEGEVDEFGRPVTPQHTAHSTAQYEDTAAEHENHNQSGAYDYGANVSSGDGNGGEEEEEEELDLS